MDAVLAGALLVLLFIWNAMNMIGLGAVSLIFLVRVRLAEAQQCRTARQADERERMEASAMQTRDQTTWPVQGQPVSCGAESRDG